MHVNTLPSLRLVSLALSSSPLFFLRPFRGILSLFARLISISALYLCLFPCLFCSLLRHLWNLSLVHYFCRSPLCSISLPPVYSPSPPLSPSLILICILAIQPNRLWLCDELTSHFFFCLYTSVHAGERCSWSPYVSVSLQSVPTHAFSGRFWKDLFLFRLSCIKSVTKPGYSAESQLVKL